MISNQRPFKDLILCVSICVDKGLYKVQKSVLGHIQALGHRHLERFGAKDFGCGAKSR